MCIGRQSSAECHIYTESTANEAIYNRLSRLYIVADHERAKCYRNRYKAKISQECPRAQVKDGTLPKFQLFV